MINEIFYNDDECDQARFLHDEDENYNVELKKSNGLLKKWKEEDGEEDCDMNHIFKMVSSLDQSTSDSLENEEEDEPDFSNDDYLPDLHY